MNIKKTLAVLAALFAILLTQSSLADYKFKLSLESFTLDPTIELNHMSMGEKVELTYYINSTFYIKGNVSYYHHDKFGEEAKLGVQHNFGKFKVFTEAGYGHKPSNATYVNQFIYKVGTSYHLFKYFSPGIEFDNFATAHSQSVKIGGEIPLNQRLSISADYIQALGRSGNGAELKLNVAF